jgi:hypothetical protein
MQLLQCVAKTKRTNMGSSTCVISVFGGVSLLATRNMAYHPNAGWATGHTKNPHPTVNGTNSRTARHPIHFNPTHAVRELGHLPMMVLRPATVDPASGSMWTHMGPCGSTWACSFMCPHGSMWTHMRTQHRSQAESTLWLLFSMCWPGLMTSYLNQTRQPKAD